MPYLTQLDFQNIIGIKVYLEHRRTRSAAAELTEQQENGRTVFQLVYDTHYLVDEKAIPLGPELPLTQQIYRSATLFAFFQDRIPERKNPAYIDYCEATGIFIDEQNPFVLLATIGKRGPSSFVFEPIFKEGFAATHVKTYRKTLGLSIREFAALFNISVSHLQKIESQKFSGKEILKFVKIYYEAPDLLLKKVLHEGGMLHTDKQKALISTLVQLIKQKNQNKSSEPE